MITFFQPIWLLVLIPLLVALWLWPLPNRLLQLLRAATFVLIVFGMAQIALKLPGKAGIVVVIADRSASMPPNATTSQKEIIDLLHKKMPKRSLLGVVSFGQQAVVECAPQSGGFPGFSADVNPDQSALADAIETALSLIPPNTSSRILILSDGKWTGRDPIPMAGRAAARSIPIDYRLIARPQVNDLAIHSFSAPNEVQPGEGFLLTAWVYSPRGQPIQYKLFRGNTIIGMGTKDVGTGLTPLMFRDIAPQHGVCEYILTIESPETDPTLENNKARVLIAVRGEKSILAVSSAGENSGLVKLLRQAGLAVTAYHPEQLKWSIDELAQFSSVILENVPAIKIGSQALHTLATWVEETGSGLMMTGGKMSYAQGGYFKSPLEPILPVSMEAPREHRKFPIAIVVALDRSGSMAAPVSGGRCKMDLANLGAAQVLDLLSPMDEFGVIAVDTSPHIVLPLDTVERNATKRKAILSIKPAGGGIFIYQALSAAAKMILSAKAESKHIILFADAADSEEPGEYRELLEKCREANITVSVIGLGTESDVDAQLLKDIAQRGGGECYFSSNAESLPALFAQDTFLVMRNTFVTEPTQIQLTPNYIAIGMPLPNDPPPIGGYNLCYPRPGANLAAITVDEFNAPIVAFWNAGTGRVLCFCGEADGSHSGQFATWEHVGSFYATLARWTAGKPSSLPNGMVLAQQVRNGACHIQLHLDPQQKWDAVLETPRVRSLHGFPNLPPKISTTTMTWKSADLLEVVIPLTSGETLINVVELATNLTATLSPVCLPYSPEFTPEQPGRGVATLAQIAAMTGGKERIQITHIWDELPTKTRFVTLTPWVFVGAIAFFLVEILERRTLLLHSLMARIPVVSKPDAVSLELESAPQKTPLLSQFFRKAHQKATTQKTLIPPPTPQPMPYKVDTDTTSQQPSDEKETRIQKTSLDTFREARERAKRRLQK